MNQRPLVSVVIVSENGRDHLESCLGSVFEQEYKLVDVIVVDNGSTDDSAGFVQDRFPVVTLLRNKDREGFGRAANTGVASARGEYVALLDIHMEVDRRWLSSLIEAMRSVPAALLASRIIRGSEGAEHPSRNETLNFTGHRITGAFEDPSTIFYAPAAALFFPRTLIGSPFPEDDVRHREDVYLSWRLRLAGHAVRLVPESVVRDRSGIVAAGQSSRQMTMSHERNRLLNALLFFEQRTLVKLLPYFLIDSVLLSVRAVFRKGDSFGGTLNAYFWLASHRRWIAERRNGVQGGRRVTDAKILPLLSHKITNGRSAGARFVNTISRLYVRLVRLVP